MLRFQRRPALRRLSIAVQLIILLLLLLATAQTAPALGQEGPAATAEPERPSPPLASAEPTPWPEGVILGQGSEAPALDTPPDSADATWIDPANPAWVVEYGSQAGRQMFPPQPAPPQFQSVGPSIALGYSRTFDFGAGDVRGIAGSPDGRLFVALRDNGLRIYIPFSAGSYRWSSVHAGGGLASDHVTALAAFGDEIWVGTSDAGISIFNTLTNAWRTLNTGNSPLPSNYINRIRAFQAPFPLHDSLWVGTGSGAASYEWVGQILTGHYDWTHVFTPANSPLVTAVEDITVQFAAHTYVWFATASTPQRWDSDANAWTPVYSISPSPACIFDGATSAATDLQGRVWLAVHVNTPAAGEVNAAGRLYTGICRYDGSGWTRYGAPPQRSRLPGDKVSDITVDPAGRVWLSVEPAGGVVFDPQGCSGEGSWLTYAPGGLLNLNVTRVQAVGEMVWFGHRDVAGLTGYGLKWKQFTTAQMGGLAGNIGPIHLEPNSAFVGVGASYAYSTGGSWSTWTPPGNTAAVSAFAVTVGSPLFYTEWIGTAGNGLFAWHNGIFSHIMAADGLPGNTIQALVIDRAGRLWVGASQGLALQAGSYWLAFHSTDSALTNNDVRALAVDGTGRVWIGTRGGGITIYDDAITGPGKWSTQRVANGLPSDMVNGLAAAPDGSMWAATDAGVAVWRPTTGAWTTYAGRTFLPSDQALSIAVDALGRVWIGTAAGLVRREVSQWQAFHISGSGLTNERVSAVAADGERVWAGAGTTALAVRGTLTGPVGLCAPAISDFTPKQGPVDTVVTISGHDFDDRGVSYNKVLFGVGNPYVTTPAEGQIQSVSATSIVVKVPALAATGKLVVQANGLTSNSSAQNFTVTPGFGIIIPACVAAGNPLTIYVNGLTGSSQTTWVKIGAGAWHPADYRDPTMIRQIVRANDTSGAVSLRIGTDGPVYTSSGVSVAQPQVVDWQIQQEVQPYPHVFGKRTLVQVRLRSSSAMCNARLNGGYMDWKLTTNEIRPAAFAPYFASPGGLSMPATAPAYSLGTVANFVGIYGLVPPDEITIEDPRFPLSQFNGVDLALSNNGVTLVSLHLPPSEFNYHTFPQKKFINFAIWPNLSQADIDTYVRDGLEGMLTGAARIYPQRDDRLAVMPGLGSAWIYWPPADGIGWNDYINLAGDNCSEVREHVQDLFDTWNDPHHENGTLWNGAGIIATQLTDGNTHMGCSYPGEWAMVAVNNDGRVGKTMMHEAFHTDSQVSESAPNYDTYNPAQGHSAYDGGKAHPSGPYTCNNDLTFAGELRYAYGSAQAIIGLYGSTPVDYSVPGCGRDAAQDIMSYADNRFNENSFPDPWLYQKLWGSWMAQASADAGEPQEAAAGASRVLYLNGNIDQAGHVTPTLSYLTVAGSSVSKPNPAGAYRLQFRTAGDQLLREFPFSVPWETSDGDPVTVAHFALHVRFPDAASKVQIRQGLQLLWSKTVSAHAPTVSFTSPNGGSYNAAGMVPVAWTANDQDGNALKFELDYSPDGSEWLPLAVSLTGTTFQWKPGFVPASATARLRIIASDGFLTGQADSALFTLTARPPLAYITAPQAGQTFLEGAAITLEGGAITSDGADADSFQWLRGAAPIGVLPTITMTLNTVGSQTFTLRVTSDGAVASRSVTINVIADYDRDGMPNAWELQYRLDPLDPTDALGDADGDGLNNLREYQLGTNPRLADTDGDGANDGAEITAGTDPLRADSKPPTVATLYVGSGDLAFTWRHGEPLPDAALFYVRGAGGRMRVSWQAASSAAWLKVSPTSGSAPTQVGIGVEPQTLSTGNYHGKVTFTASAAGSPYEVAVTLRVLPRLPSPVYLPLLRKRGR